MERKIAKLTAGQLNQLLEIRQKIDFLNKQIGNLENKMEEIIKVRKLIKRVRKTMPKAGRKVIKKLTQRAAIIKILSKADKSLSAHEIYRRLIAQKIKFKSKKPLKSLRIKLYTDKTFYKAKPGFFTLRNTSAKKQKK